MLGIKLEDEKKEEEIGEVTEYQGIKKQKDVEFSIHLVSGLLLQSKIKLHGTLGDKDITILLDGGSSHSFIKLSVANWYPKLVQTLTAFKVQVTKGESLTYHEWMAALTRKMQGHSFTHDNDLILGID